MSSPRCPYCDRIVLKPGYTCPDDNSECNLRASAGLVSTRAAAAELDPDLFRDYLYEKRRREDIAHMESRGFKSADDYFADSPVDDTPDCNEFTMPTRVFTSYDLTDALRARIIDDVVDGTVATPRGLSGPNRNESRESMRAWYAARDWLLANSFYLVDYASGEWKEWSWEKGFWPDRIVHARCVHVGDDVCVEFKTEPAESWLKE